VVGEREEGRRYGESNAGGGKKKKRYEVKIELPKAKKTRRKRCG
jgi:hypothetical protein